MSKQPNTQYITPDKRIISLNLQELNLLQSIILLMPTPDVALKIKKQFGIPLSVTEIVSEMRNIHSPLYRYLKALQMSIVARCLMLREENFKEMLKHLRAKSEHELMLIERKNLKRKLGALFHKYVFRKYIESLNQVAVESMQTIPLPLKIEARDYLIEAHKSNLLRFYLKHAPANMVSLILEIVETQVRMIQRNYELLDSIRSRPDLSSKQKEELDEWEERYANHLLASEPERMERVLSHLDLDDPIVLKQTSNHGVINESIHGIGLQNIVKYEKKIFKELNNEQVHETHEESEAVLQKVQYNQLNYRTIQNDLNEQLVNIVDINKDVLIVGLKEIIEFVEILSSAIAKEKYRKTNAITVYNGAINLIDKLTEIKEIDYSMLIEWLKEKFDVRIEAVKSKQTENLHDQLTEVQTPSDLFKNVPGLSQSAVPISESQQKAIAFWYALMCNSSISKTIQNEGDELLKLLKKPFCIEDANSIMNLINEIRLKLPEAEELEEFYLILDRYVEEQQNLVNQL